MYSWRATKYNPAYRDPNGAYTRDEWTAASDIGRTFAGEVLNVETYLRVEDAYVSTAKAFMRDARAVELAITDLESNQDSDSRLIAASLHIDPTDGLQEGSKLSGQELELTFRRVLRGILWCKFEVPTQFFVHFGYDYYMYIGSTEPSTTSIDFARHNGLFVESMMSPYSSNRWDEAESPTDPAPG